MNILEDIRCSGSYLSENIDRFPFAEPMRDEDDNLFRKADRRKHILFINKGITGCGGTTLVAETALSEFKDVICLLPSVSAVQSKENQFAKNKRVQCMYGSKRLVSLPDGSVVFATYDQIGNIRAFLKDRCGDFMLVVDEYHTFTRDVFRNRAMRAVLESFKDFKSVTLLTATPDKYLEEAVEKIFDDWEISRLNYVWTSAERAVTLYSFKKDKKRSSLTKALASIVRRFMDSPGSPNLYVMLNSLTGIGKITEKAGLGEDDYYLLCSKSQENVVNRADIEDINSKPRKITFLTAAGFEGCDIKDPQGMVLTVVDVTSSTCMFDWQTLVQMQGRCRGSLVQPAILYYSDNVLNKDTKMELSHRIEELRMKEKKMKSMRWDDLEKDEDVAVINNKLTINPFSISQVQRKLEVSTSMIKYSDFINYLKTNGYDVYEQTVPEIGAKRIQTRSFKAQVKSYLEGDKKNLHDLRLIETLLDKYGRDRLVEMIDDLNYSKSQLKRMVKATSDDGLENCRTLMGLRSCSWYSSALITKRIEELNGIAGTAYGTRYLGQTLLELGYRAVPERQTVNGKRTNGFFIVIPTSKLAARLGSSFLYRKVSSNDQPKRVLNENTLKLSIATTKGNNSYYYRQCTLEEALEIGKKFPTTVKEEQYYIGDGYAEGTYRRRQEYLKAVDCMILDVDHFGSIKDFNEYVDSYLGGAFHYLYETYSSTPEANRFRAIFPMTSTLTLYNADFVRAYKKTKIQMFPEFQDSSCPMWVFAPYKEVKTYGNPDVLLDADAIAEIIEDRYVYDQATKNINKEVWTTEEETEARNQAIAKYQSKEAIVERINSAADGDRENTIWRCVSIMRQADIEYVRSNIRGTSPEDLQYRLRRFDEKVERRLRENWKLWEGWNATRK